MNVPKVLLTNHHLVNYAGSELVTLDLAIEFQQKGWNVTVATFVFGGDIEKRFNEVGIEVINVLHKSLSEIEFDLVWSHHFPVLIKCLVEDNVRTKSLILSSLSPYEPLETIPFFHSKSDLILCNSEETKKEIIKSKGMNFDEEKLFVFRNSVPSNWFNLYLDKGDFELRNIAMISNHPPAEILDAINILKSKKINVDLIGIPGTSKLVNIGVLSSYDAVVTIGRTVQHCMTLGIPVFCYDHFGGPGWLTPDNYEIAEWFNYSGRCCHQKFSSEQIVDNLIDGFIETKKHISFFRNYAIENYSLTKNIETVLNCINNANRENKEYISFDSEQVIGKVGKAYRNLFTERENFKQELERSQSNLQHTQTELERSQSNLQHTQVELERSQSNLQQTQAELERSQSNLQQAQAELERSQSNLQQAQAELERSQSNLQQTQAELERSQPHLQDTQAQLESYQHQLQATQTESEKWQNLVCWMETSKFWKLRRLYLNIKQKVTKITNINFYLLELVIKSFTVIRKEGYETFNKRALNFLTHKKVLGFRAKTTFTETLVTEVLQILADSSEYGQWIKEYEPTHEELKKQKNQAFSFNYQPVISVILPVYKLPIAILKETINSVLQQTYTRWELCIAFADISNFDAIKYIKNLSLQDKRIKLAILPENKGISGNSNVCLEIATGEFLALLDHDDLLSNWAFYEVVSKLNKEPDLDFIYSDKDCICANSTIRSRLLLKPEWSPEILYSANYLTHLCIARRELVNSIGGFRPETDGAQDWDLFLRISEQTSRIARINSVLYHWRIIRGSTSLGIDSKPYALEAQLKSLKDHLSRTQLPATISPHPESSFRLEWKTPPAKVSIVIDGEVSWNYLSACINGVSVFADQNLHKVKIVLPESNYYSQASEIKILTEQINLPIDWLLVSEGNSKLATLAEAARQDTPDVVLFVSGQIVRFQEGCIEELSGWVLNHPDIGFTSALILTNQNIVVEAGLIVDKHDNGFPLFYGRNLYTWEVFGGALWYRNCSASSPWAIAFNYQHYLSLEGLPTDSPSVKHSIIKLCQASRAANKRGLVNPHARAFLEDLPEYNLPKFDNSLANDPYFHPAFASVVPLKLRAKNGER